MKAGFAALLIFLSSSIAPAGLSSDRFDSYLGTWWYGVYMEDSKIGYASINLEKQEVSKWSLIVDLRLKMLMQQMEIEIISIDKRFYEGENAFLVSNEMINKSPLGDLAVNGNHIDQNYEIELEIMGNKQVQELAYPVESLDDQVVIMAKAIEGNLKTGDTFTQEIFVFDPSMLGRMKHIVTATEKKQMLFSGLPTEVYTFRDSIPVMRIAGTSYCDLNGNVLLQEYPSMGMVMKLEPEEVAKNDAVGWDVITDNIIESENGPNDQLSVTSGKYLLSGFDLDYLPANPWTSVNELADGKAELVIEQKSQEKYDMELPINGDDFKEFLKSEPLIQSDNEQIIKLADDIIADETNAFEAARAINNWVFTNIEKRFSPVISNAIQTLTTMQGDCGEHSALTVALMRAAGIPARTAGGIGYVPSLSGFGYHAWVEVYVGEWIQMDPTWGETFADATHIMLARGDLKDLIAAVAGAMNSLDIQILEYK